MRNNSAVGCLALFGSLALLLVHCGSQDGSSGASQAGTPATPATPATSGEPSGPDTTERDAGDAAADARGDGSADGSRPGVAGTPVTDVVTGTSHTCAILKSGPVKCWGSGKFGALGLGDKNNRGDQKGEMGAALPVVQLGTGRTAKKLCAGGVHTCAILDDGTVKCWGTNNAGQLGQGDTPPRGDDPGEMGDALPRVDLGLGRTASALSCGAVHTCALLDDASMKCWGGNPVGQLGIGSNQNRGDQPGEMGAALGAASLGAARTVKRIGLASSQQTCAILDNDALKCWGENERGQAGVVGSLSGVGAGSGDMGDALLPLDLGGGHHAVAVAGGKYHTCAILDTGAVNCWGSVLYGMLGRGTGGTGFDSSAKRSSVALGTGRTATALQLGDKRTCALLDNQTLKCWGENGGFSTSGLTGLARGDNAGEMGDALPAVNVGTGRTIRRLSSGTSNHLCVVLDDDSAKCFGMNYEGALGLGDTIPRGGEGAGQVPGDLLGDALPVLILE